MRVGSLFAGIGGFDLGLERAGMQVIWQCEIDPFCLQILAKHWSHVKRYGDIRQLTGDELEPVDLICGGFPCQDLSVAGKRAGLAGERSGLFFECARLIATLRPRWVLIENVPGLLSSNGGRDMGTVLWTLAELGYGYAYRVFDAQYFGVAQRRRRVFIVGCLGDWAAAAKVLFEPESCERDTPPGREAGKDIARALTSSTGGVSGKEQQATYVASTTGRGWWNEGFGTLRADAGGMEQSGHLIAYQCHVGNVGPMGTLRQGTGSLTGGVPFVAYPLRAEGHDASEDGLGRQTLIPVRAYGIRAANTSSNGWGIQEEASHTLDQASSHFVATSMFVRRLTPTECERLQGFPDDWTAMEEKTADSPRYRALGNAVCVNVAEWIGKRIMEVEHETRAA